MTDNEIIKALECCSTYHDVSSCKNCPLDGKCEPNMLEQYALDLINRQEGVNEKNENIIRVADKTIATLNAENESLKAEVERLNKHNEILMEKVDNLIFECDCAKQEAYKEFAELVHCHCESIINQEWNKKVSPVSWADAYKEFDNEVDNFLNELVGGDNPHNIDKQN